MVKFLLSIIILFSLSSTVNAERVFLIVGAKWCQYCGPFKDRILADKEIKSLLRQYDSYYVDFDTNRELAKKYKVTRLPSALIVDVKKNGEEEIDTVLWKEALPSNLAVKTALKKYSGEQVVKPKRPLLELFKEPVKFFKKTLVPAGK